MRQPVYFFVFQEKTAFIPVKYLYPECFILIEEHPKVEPFQCFAKECPANKNCAETIANRVHYLFENVLPPKVEQLFAYFNYRNDGFNSKGEFIPSLGAALFYKDLTEPSWMKINRWGFNKLKNEGHTMMWMPTDEYLFMYGSDEVLIAETDLIR